MTALAPLDSLYERTPDRGVDVPLPPELGALYGRLQFPLHSGRPYLIGNFVETIDGVVSLNAPGQSGGNEISGFNQHDRMVMGILRAVADTIVVGAGTHRAAPDHLWTAEFIYPPLADIYRELRTTLGKPGPPLNVIVTASGEIDQTLPVFQSGQVPVLLVTTDQGASRLRRQEWPASVQIATVPGAGRLGGRAILDVLEHFRSSDIILVEGGPQFMGSLFAEHCLDELFLTLAPQMAGRDGSVERPGVVAGQTFAPEHPLWGTLAGVRRAGSHLFLRYAFETAR
jgi:riboflavin biosynthesis pyrimidine reductase